MICINDIYSTIISLGKRINTYSIVDIFCTMIESSFNNYNHIKIMKNINKMSRIKN